MSFQKTQPRKTAQQQGQCSFYRGYVTAVDEQLGRARVMIDDLGMETFWLSLPQSRVKEDQSVDWVDVGDFVGLISDEKLEDGMILGCCYSKKNPPPKQTVDVWYRRFSDGTEISYNRATSTLEIDGPLQITIKATRIDWNP